MGSIIDGDGVGRRHWPDRHRTRRRSRGRAARRGSSATAPCRPIRRSRACRAFSHRAWPRPGSKRALGRFPAEARLSGPDFSFGTSIPDTGCAARLDARTLWSMGLKKAAVARLCLNDDIYRAMPEVCRQYLPPAPRHAIHAPAAGRLPATRRQRSLRRAALHRRRRFWLVEGRDRQEPSLQRLRCDPAELPCLGSHRPPFGTEEEDGDGRRLRCEGPLRENR